MSGVKHDGGKARVSLLTREFLYGTSEALAYGANKYGKDNYKKGMEWSRILDASFRHLIEFASKNDFDEESKLNHLKHVAANMNMLIYYYEKSLGIDDR